MLKPIEDNNSNLSLCYIGYLDHPHCKKHGAMIRVAEQIKMYRCPGMHNDGACRAGCIREIIESLNQTRRFEQ